LAFSQALRHVSCKLAAKKGWRLYALRRTCAAHDDAFGL